MRPVTFETILNENDFDRVWDYLETKYGYSREWRKECHKYASDRVVGSRLNPIDFLIFCNHKINTLLNAVLCETKTEPTFMRIIYWMFQDRIFGGNNLKEP